LVEFAIMFGGVPKEGDFFLGEQTRDKQIAVAAVGGKFVGA
jgi:hypothetical protein